MDAPDRIFLQVNVVPGETTWCRDRITNDDVEYIRADLVEPESPEPRRPMQPIGPHPTFTMTLPEAVKAMAELSDYPLPCTEEELTVMRAEILPDPDKQ